MKATTKENTVKTASSLNTSEKHLLTTVLNTSKNQGETQKEITAFMKLGKEGEKAICAVMLVLKNDNDTKAMNVLITQFSRVAKALKLNISLKKGGKDENPSIGEKAAAKGGANAKGNTTDKAEAEPVRSDIETIEPVIDHMSNEQLEELVFDLVAKLDKMSQQAIIDYIKGGCKSLQKAA